MVAALALLGRRDFCSAELRERLSTQGFGSELLETLLADLVARRYVDDERYAHQFVSYRTGRGHGPLRIERDLADLGVPGALIDAALAEGPPGGWVSLARQIRRRRFGTRAPKDWAERARQARFLQYRGFTAQQIRAAGVDVDEGLDTP